MKLGRLGSEQILSPESKLAVSKSPQSQSCCYVPPSIVGGHALCTPQAKRGVSPCFSTSGILNICLQHSMGWMVIPTTTDSVFRKLSSEWWWRGVFGLDKLFLCHLILVQHKILNLNLKKFKNLKILDTPRQQDPTFVPKQHLLLAFGYLSRHLHFIHGLQPALHELGGAEDQSSKGRGKGTSSCILQITGRTQAQEASYPPIIHSLGLSMPKHWW